MSKESKTPAQLLYEFMKLQGICPRCKSQWASELSQYCSSCHEKAKTYGRKNMANYRARQRAMPPTSLIQSIVPVVTTPTS